MTMSGHLVSFLLTTRKPVMGRGSSRVTQLEGTPTSSPSFSQSLLLSAERRSFCKPACDKWFPALSSCASATRYANSSLAISSSRAVQELVRSGLYTPNHTCTLGPYERTAPTLFPSCTIPSLQSRTCAASVHTHQDPVAFKAAGC
jgi:hypothetical protein